MDFRVKGWHGKQGVVVAKCKYCNSFSLAEVMIIDPTDKKAYHKQCKENREREEADVTQNLSENK